MYPRETSGSGHGSSNPGSRHSQQTFHNFDILNSSTNSNSNQQGGGFTGLVSHEIGESSRRREIEFFDKEENSAASLFPHDIMMKIALGLPVKSLLRFLRVSKEWQSSIRSKHFRDEYLSKSLNRQQTRLLLTLACEDKCFVFTSPGLESSDEASFSTLASYNMTHTMRPPNTIAPSVYGLICYGEPSGFFIYNPCTRRTIVLHAVPTNKRKKVVHHYIGYAADSGYKVLCTMGGRPQVGDAKLLVEEIWVLTLGNELFWRKVKDIPAHYVVGVEVCIDGVLYYNAFTGSSLSEHKIMSFDVSSEKLHLIRAPEVLNVSGEYLNNRSKPTSYEGKVAVLFFRRQSVFVVFLWVLDDVVNEEWLDKTFLLPSLIGWTTDLNIEPYSATNAGDVVLAPSFVRASTFRVLYYNPEKDSLRKIEIEGIRNHKVQEEVKRWWYCYPVSVFPDLVENLLFL